MQSRGPDVARGLALTEAERKCVELAAARSISEDAPDLVHALPLITTLPHHAAGHLRTWQQDCFDATQCRWEVRGGDPQEAIPTGGMARRILVHYISEAVRGTQRLSPREATLYLWSRHLSSPAMGGRTYLNVRRTLDRIAACRTYIRHRDADGQWREVALDWPDYRKPLDDIAQSSLAERVTRELAPSLVALRRSAFLSVRGSSIVTDIYIFLATVLPGLTASRSLAWHDLWCQFGAGYKRRNQWVAAFGDALLLALVAYPEARVAFDTQGLTLYPSLSPFGARERR